MAWVRGWPRKDRSRLNGRVVAACAWRTCEGGQAGASTWATTRRPLTRRPSPLSGAQGPGPSTGDRQEVRDLFGFSASDPAHLVRQSGPKPAVGKGNDRGVYTPHGQAEQIHGPLGPGSQGWGCQRQQDGRRSGQAGGREAFPGFFRGPRSGQVAGWPLPSPPKDYRAAPQGDCPVDCLPCATRVKAPSPGSSGLRRKALRKVRKPLAGRCYQLLLGHGAIGYFLHERLAGPPRLESSECRWCGNGKRESSHHLFTECQAWAPQIRRLWKRVYSGPTADPGHPRMA